MHFIFNFKVICNQQKKSVIRSRYISFNLERKIFAKIFYFLALILQIIYFDLFDCLILN